MSSSPRAPVFHDPSGRRRWWFHRLLAGLLLVGAVLSTVFAASMLLVPFLPQLDAFSGLRHHVRPPKPAIPSRKARLERYLSRRSREKLWREISAAKARSDRRRAAAVTAKDERSRAVAAAFYAPWQETGLESLRLHAKELTHLFPEWLRLDPTGTKLDTRDFDLASSPHNRDAIAIAREHGLEIHPMLSNSESGEFDAARVHLLLASVKRQHALATALRTWLVEQRFQGLNLDFENLADHDYLELAGFIEILAQELHSAGLQLSADIEAGLARGPLERFGKSLDLVVLMAYDEHYAGGAAGPIAPLPWFTKAVERTLRHVPRDRLVIGLGNYAYDWKKGGGHAEPLSWEQAMARARGYRPDEPPKDVIELDGDALNASFEYTDEEDGDAEHVVWMLDAISAYDQWLTARQAEPRGVALWVLGSEDPGVWRFFGRPLDAPPPPPASLDEISPPSEIEYEGKGEILSLRSGRSEGRRTVSADSSTGLITELRYETLPSPVVIGRSGHKPHAVALTFDDGPDPQFTPAVLDVLRAHGLRATFFVIGQSAERYPDLVRRIWREGHDIGSHSFTHPNLAAVGRSRAVLELNATQRAIEAILGRSTILFRPPYNADAEPTSAEEVVPIEIAAELGYLTVGELIDPQDWKLFEVRPDGARVERSAKEMADRVLEGVERSGGNIVLLHDGGGDRARTVEAIGLLLPELRKRGKDVVPVSALIGRSREELMPEVGGQEALLAGVDRIVFDVLFIGETLLGVAFFAAVVLGIARVLMLVPLVIIGRIRERRRAEALGPVKSSVSVLIAAYNEQPVIRRTIESILKSDQQADEIVVVDDGSSDGTADEVAAAFSAEPRVRLIRQANAGKAAALNRAIEGAQGEVLVCLDADTQLAPDAMRLMARHFTDPAIGAVAGNVKVGNRVNMFTRWQAIEYVISQNLDRRAYSVISAITVVPGAVGAWRKSAVASVGGYVADTLAEDMDLTFRLRRAGWKLTADTDAIGYTEAPQALGPFFKQRFRWAYGTLQCLWKHRGALFRYGWFGRLALPAMWTFQVVFQFLAPLVDLQMLYAILHFGYVWISQGLLDKDWQPLPNATHVFLQTGFFYALFFAVELLGAAIAFRLDRERMRTLWWLFWQRLGYRQLMYAVSWKAALRAIHGLRQGWGKLERKGTVEVPKA